MSQLVNEEVLASLRELGGDDANFLPQLIRIFLADVPPELEKLRSSVTKGQADAMARHAHSLTSSSQNLGVSSMEEICHELQTKGRAGSLDGADVLVEKLHSIFGEVKIYFEKILKETSA